MTHAHEGVSTFIHIEDGEDDIRKLLRTLHEEHQHLKTPAPKKGNPAVVGLAGFGATTLLLQFHNLGWIGVGPIVWLAIVFGGGAQLIAGLMEYGTGNNFGFCAFTTYGSFWISLAAILISKQLKLYEISEEEIGAFMLIFTFITIFLWIASARLNMALFVVFTLLIIGFVLLDITFLAEKLVLAKVAGVVLILCALAAWYCMCHIIFLDVNQGKDYLPLGPSPYTLIFERKTPMINVRPKIFAKP